MLLLVGGNGFIGRHLTLVAHQRGIRCVIVTPVADHEFVARNAPSARMYSLTEFLSAAGDRLLMEAKALVYLASRSVPASHIEAPARELTENVEPAFEMFARVGRIRPELPIVFISSGGAVYGRTSYDRTPETHPLRPISPYALGKVLTEQCLIYCGDTAGQFYAILRVSNPIGRWQRNIRQGLAMAGLRAIRSGTTLEIFGDGSAVRDYLDADDLADAILAVALSGTRNSGIWNVGSGVGHSVLDVVDAIALATGQKPKLAFKPSRGIDVPKSVLDPTLFARDFGWRARVSLTEAIEKLVQSSP